MRVIILLIIVFVICLALAIGSIVLHDNSCGSILENILATFGVIFIVADVIVAIIIICFLIEYHTVRSPYWQEQKHIELETRRSAMEYAMREDANIIELASTIAEYNEEVLKGRHDLDSKWFHDLTYPFWDDIPLIEIDSQ